MTEQREDSVQRIFWRAACTCKCKTKILQANFFEAEEQSSTDANLLQQFAKDNFEKCEKMIEK